MAVSGNMPRLNAMPERSHGRLGVGQVAAVPAFTIGCPIVKRELRDDQRNQKPGQVAEVQRRIAVGVRRIGGRAVHAHRTSAMASRPSTTATISHTTAALYDARNRKLGYHTQAKRHQHHLSNLPARSRSNCERRRCASWARLNTRSRLKSGMTSEIRIIVITAGSRLSGVPMANRKKASPIPGSAKTVLIQVMTAI